MLLNFSKNKEIYYYHVYCKIRIKKICDLIRYHLSRQYKLNGEISSLYYKSHW